MRRLVAYMLVSIDGVAEAPETFVLDWDDVMDANLGEIISTQTAVLLGRGMYDEWAAHWPPSDMEPFAPFINQVPKYVVTSSPLAQPWTHAQRLEGDPWAAIEQLKAAGEGDIGLHGSLALTTSMLAAGLVDDLRLLVAPCTVGQGRRFFSDDASPRDFELVSSVGTPTGALLLHYRRR